MCPFGLLLRRFQKSRRNIPALALIRDYGNGLLVVFHQNPGDCFSSIRFELNSFSDPELQHLLVRTRLAQEIEPFNNTVIQVNEFFFRQLIYINHDRPSDFETLLGIGSIDPYADHHLWAEQPVRLLSTVGRADHC